MAKIGEKEKPIFNLLIEELVTNIGGCGRYQWIISFLIHFAKTCMCWSMIHMTFNGQEPGYVCQDPDDQANSTTIQHEGTCDPVNHTCDIHVYSDEMSTIVNEWDLVCDRKWSVAMVTTIQMSGVLLGCFIAGILGDMIGRKPTYFLSLLIVIVCNIIAYFSVSWEMYAAVRCGIGFGVGFYFSVQYNLMTEFMPTIWRPRAIAIPGWSIESGLFALVVWLLKDWKHVHLATAAVGLPFLLSFWFVQESSRWLITKQRYNDAEKSIHYIAKVNGYDAPDVSKIISCAEEEMHNKANTKTNASLLDLGAVLLKCSVNAQGRCIRTLKEVKKKLSDLKTTLKKRERERRQLLFKTGGGPPPAPLCMDDEKLLGVIGEVSTFGFDGFDTFDYMDSSDTRSNNEKECLTESNPASTSSTAIIEENDDLTEKQILLQILKEQKKMNELLSKHFSVST